MSHTYEIDDVNSFWFSQPILSPFQYNYLLDEADQNLYSSAFIEDMYDIFGLEVPIFAKEREEIYDHYKDIWGYITSGFATNSYICMNKYLSGWVLAFGLAHELQHIKQYIDVEDFVNKYDEENTLTGYKKNKYEIEANNVACEVLRELGCPSFTGADITKATALNFIREDYKKGTHIIQDDILKTGIYGNAVIIGY